jgi:glucose-6-phosphate 1-epimerase
LQATFGDALAIQWEIENTGKQPFRFEQALHTYFLVGDVQRIAVRGLDGVGYADNKDGGARKTQQGPLRLQGETERYYHGSTATVAIDDPVLGRSIEMQRQGACSTLVWHPWQEKAKEMGDFDAGEWDKMVCVEAANVRDDAITLPPGKVHSLAMTIRVARLPATTGRA